MVTLLAIVLLVLLLIGTPLFAVLLGATMLGFYTKEVDLTVIAAEIFRIVDTPLLVALPLFTFTGYLLSESQTSQRLLHIVRVFFGWMPDGLALVAIVACALFTAFTGASGVTILAVGALLLPALIKQGYSERFSLGLVTTSGSMGLLLPPSIPLIIYGIIVQQMGVGEEFTLEELFLAGLLPGVLMMVAVAAWVLWVHRGQSRPRMPFSWPEAKASVMAARWELPLPFFVLGGIFGGFLAISEVAAVAALYVLIVELIIYREIRFAQLPKIMSESMTMVGGIILILGIALAFSNFLIDAEVPTTLLDWIKSHVDSKLSFLLLLNVILLIIGAVLDIFSAIVILVPLLLPIAIGYGIHPLHLGVIIVANMQIGYFTPPVGMSLFIASYRFDRTLAELTRATVPFLFVLLATVLIITYWPDLTLVLITK